MSTFRARIRTTVRWIVLLVGVSAIPVAGGLYHYGYISTDPVYVSLPDWGVALLALGTGLVGYGIARVRYAPSSSQRAQASAAPEHVPAPSGAWADYQTDAFDGATWRWDWDGNTPVNIRVVCDRDDCQSEVDVTPIMETRVKEEDWSLEPIEEEIQVGSKAECPNCDYHHEWEAIPKNQLDRIRREILVVTEHRYPSFERPYLERRR